MPESWAMDSPSMGSSADRGWRFPRTSSAAGWLRYGDDRLWLFTVPFDTALHTDQSLRLLKDTRRLCSVFCDAKQSGGASAATIYALA